ASGISPLLFFASARTRRPARGTSSPPVVRERGISMICLSFDTDHLNEERLTDFLETHRFPGRATIFCHQRFDCLRDIKHELAPHPFLAEGGDWMPELSEKRQMLPTATGWRSHSCVFSHILARWLGENGYSYVSVDERFGEV